MVYIPNTSCPANGNKYYNIIKKGGISTCVQGNQTTGCYNDKLSTLPNCVGYAGGRFNEIVGCNTFKYALNCNAEDFITRAKKLGLQTGTTPMLGAIIVWSKGEVGKSSDGAGHVAIVEKIISDTEIITGESGWSSKKLFWTQNRKLGSNKNWGQSTAYKFLGFVYNPVITENTKPRLSRGDSGKFVKELQTKLVACNLSVVVDGIFGGETLTAVKTLQKKYKLTVDGIVGEKTYEAIEKEIKANTKPAGVSDLNFILDGKAVSAWSMSAGNQNYIRMADLQTLGIVKSVEYVNNKVVVKTK